MRTWVFFIKGIFIVKDREKSSAAHSQGKKRMAHCKNKKMGFITKEGYLQVSHEVAEQVVHRLEDELMRLLPPPIPKEESSFWMFLLLHDVQATVFSPPIETSVSK
jgi:hypothetical protein